MLLLYLLHVIDEASDTVQQHQTARSTIEGSWIIASHCAFSRLDAVRHTSFRDPLLFPHNQSGKCDTMAIGSKDQPMLIVSDDDGPAAIDYLPRKKAKVVKVKKEENGGPTDKEGIRDELRKLDDEVGHPSDAARPSLSTLIE